MNLLKTAGLLAMAACSTWAADLLPLQFGNSWTYREAVTGQTFTVRVGLPVATDTHVYYDLRGYVDAPLLVRVNERNQLVALDRDTGAEVPVTDFAPFEAGWWEAPYRQCDQQGQTIEKRGTHDGPAGPIADVLEIRYRTLSCADTGVQFEQFAENIGMVRRVLNSFAGPRTYNLVNARVGKLVIEASANGRFTVAVDQSARTLAITWRVQTSSGDPIILKFASGQEYDAVIRDASGRVVWQWSADQMFTQAFHERSVSGEWSGSITAPIAGLSPGSYTVQTWLTSGTPPLFSATAPVTLK